MKYFRSLVDRKIASTWVNYAKSIKNKLEIGDVFEVKKIENNATICYAVCESVYGFIFWVENKRLKNSGEFKSISEKEYNNGKLLKKLKE